MLLWHIDAGTKSAGGVHFINGPETFALRAPLPLNGRLDGKMKDVPPEIRSVAPEGTEWFGGSVELSKIALRVHCPETDRGIVAALLDSTGTESHRTWRLRAPDSVGADLDGQIDWIFSQLTPDLGRWNQVSRQYRIDLFCGLFLERQNRGVSLAPHTMAAVAARGISLGFDIYGPD